MKLYGSLTSPFVRAVRIAALELGLDEKIIFVPTVVRPTQPNMDYGTGVNPLRRVPALETGDGNVLVDSRIIIEHLNALVSGALVPADAPSRIAALNRHAAMAAATEALVAAMYERKLRPSDKRWDAWADDQIDKAAQALTWAEARADQFFGTFDIGTIGLVCLIGYAQFRFPETDWLDGLPTIGHQLSELENRDSVSATAPSE